MAKIDVTQIEGYAAMTAEEKLKALEAFDMPDPDYSGYVRKDLFDKTASELADKKKELLKRMTDDEATKQKEKENRESMQKELDALRRESAVSKTKAKLIALGYDETLAEETAEAMADGQTDKVFANQQKHLTAFEKKIRADALKDTPKPTPDPAKGGVDYNKKISEAQSNGDFAAEAYYTRLQAQEAANQTGTS